MFNFSKNILICFLGFFITLSQPGIAAPHEIIPTYADLLHALSSGNEVRAIFDANDCTASSSERSGIHLGGFNFTQFTQYEMSINQQKREVIATSVTMLVDTPRFGPVYNYVRLRVFPDNSAELYSQFLDPKTFVPIMNKTFLCHLSAGDHKGGVTLFNLDR